MKSKPIGPTFFSELERHGGLIGQHFSWTPEGQLIFFDDTPESVRVGVEEVYAAHDPAAKPVITVFTPREFAKRFTQDELLAIRAAQFSDMEVGLVYDDFNRAEFIDLADPYVAQGIALYVAKGLLAVDRKAALLAPEVASENPEGQPE